MPSFPFLCNVAIWQHKGEVSFFKRNKKGPVLEHRAFF